MESNHAGRGIRCLRLCKSVGVALLPGAVFAASCGDRLQVLLSAWPKWSECIFVRVSAAANEHSHCSMFCRVAKKMDALNRLAVEPLTHKGWEKKAFLTEESRQLLFLFLCGDEEFFGFPSYIPGISSSIKAFQMTNDANCKIGGKLFLHWSVKVNLVILASRWSRHVVLWASFSLIIFLPIAAHTRNEKESHLAGPYLRLGFLLLGSFECVTHVEIISKKKNLSKIGRTCRGPNCVLSFIAFFRTQGVTQFKSQAIVSLFCWGKGIVRF